MPNNNCYFFWENSTVVALQRELHVILTGMNKMNTYSYFIFDNPDRIQKKNTPINKMYSILIRIYVTVALIRAAA